MDKYIGVKLLEHAEPMTHGEFVKVKYPESPLETEFSKANVNKEGYLVQYEGGYISWSPKKEFEDAYRRIDNLTFGLAVEGMKKGHKMNRKAWNGNGAFVYYVPANIYKSQTEIIKKEFGEEVSYDPYLAIKNQRGTITMFTPGVDSILAEDWQIAE